MGSTIKARNPFFDVLKAVAIFMVVLQHCYIYLGNGEFEPNAINQGISLVSVPTFMMVCGYFMYTSQWTFKKLFDREVGLLIPFLFWSFAYFFVFHSIFYKNISFINYAYALVSAPYFCSPLWFFRALIIITAMAFLCRKLSWHWDVLSLIGLFVVFNVVNLLMTGAFAIQSVAANLGYFIIGYAMNKYNLMQKKSFNLVRICCIPIFVIAIFLKINGLQIGGGILFKVCNYSGILALSWIIKSLCDIKFIKAKVIMYLGSHTLEVYATHFFWVYTMMIIGVPVSHSFTNMIMLVYACVAVTLSLGVACLVGKIKLLNFIIYGRR